MIKKEIIPDDDGKGFVIAMVSEDVEKVNPIGYYQELFYEHYKNFLRMLFLTNKPPFPMSVLEPFIEKKTKEAWEEYFKNLMAVEVPKPLFSILNADNKKYQQRFLRGIELTPEILTAFICRAYTEYDYTLSIYSGEHLPSGTDETEVPKMIHLDGDKVSKSEETTLTDGQLKQIVEQRSATYAKMLDRGTEWHCFFITIESIAGKENWQGGQPHYHYISDKFGIPRDEVVAQVRTKDYRLFSLPHIVLKDYGNQPEEKQE